MNITKIRATLLGLFIVVILSCGGGTVISSAKCTLRCDHVTDDTEWDECMLECHQEIAE